MNPVIDKERRVKLDRDEVLNKARHYWIWRRSQDIVLSVLALLILWPWMLLIAIIIVIDSPGASPIFAQKRVGRDGKKFTFYKFRSMKPNAEAELDDLLDQNEMDGPVFKIKKDPRITRVGRFIRATRLDELPQILNILKGDMSVVGPRPERPEYYERFEKYIHGFSQRLKVKPGLTGLAQVRGGYYLMPQEKILYDMEYIKTRTMWLDIKIVFETVKVVFNGEGAK